MPIAAQREFVHARPSSGRSAGLAVPAAIFACLACAATARADAARGALEYEVRFDLPALPLAEALDAFSAASGYQVLVATTAMPGFVSPPVSGTMAPREALKRLVAGAGLGVRSTGPRAVVLAPEHPLADSSPSPDAAEGSSAFDASVASAVARALCADPSITPGGYRAALELWVSPRGRVERAELLATTGDASRDRRIADALRSLVTTAPPPGLPQPTTVVLLPSRMGAEIACAVALSEAP